MKRSAVRNSTLRSGCMSRMRQADGIEQMGLAEARGGMNEQRIEGDGRAGAASVTRRRRHGRAVGAADDEALECLGRIERRAAFAGPLAAADRRDRDSVPKP